MKHNVVVVDTIYRDGVNGSVSGETYFLNDTDISVDTILNLLKGLIQFNEGIIAEDHYLNNQAPLRNEFLLLDSTKDHPYIEIKGIRTKHLRKKRLRGLRPFSDFIESVIYSEQHSKKKARERAALNELSQVKWDIIRNQPNEKRDDIFVDDIAFQLTLFQCETESIEVFGEGDNTNIIDTFTDDAREVYDRLRGRVKENFLDLQLVRSNSLLDTSNI